MNFSKVVAIDGPSGSGKSELAKMVARDLNILYVDTGSMYRAVGFCLNRDEIAFEEGDKLNDFLANLDFSYGDAPNCLVAVAGENLTEKIREHQVSEFASIASKLEPVRKFLFDHQRALGQERFSVLEGRDIGTVIFPDAFCKIFLSADVTIRAERRFQQLQNLGDSKTTLETVLEDLKIRDERDTTRKIAPLKKADDAVEIDSSHMTLDEVKLEIIKIVKNKAKDLGLEL